MNDYPRLRKSWDTPGVMLEVVGAQARLPAAFRVETIVGCYKSDIIVKDSRQVIAKNCAILQTLSSEYNTLHPYEEVMNLLCPVIVDPDESISTH